LPFYTGIFLTVEEAASLLTDDLIARRSALEKMADARSLVLSKRLLIALRGRSFWLIGVVLMLSCRKKTAFISDSQPLNWRIR
jgi:hypothetical protein